MSDRPADATRSLPADPVTLPHDPDATRTRETSSSPAAPPELPPNFAFVSELGRGAMGVVYSARQISLNRTVALKMVLAGAHASKQELARFLAEVQAAAAVEHPNVVRVYESGEHRGTPYLAMELVSGGTLAAKLDGKPLPPREAAELLAQVAAGVQAAHAAGIVHRDLKPGNILLAADGTPKVADFGLAKRLGGTDLTHTGAILGTPGYMAPEQARGQGKAVGPPADVYALGAVLFTALAGRPPFVANDPLEVVPPSLRGLVKGVPRDLETIVSKCLRKDPAGRYANAGELADDLRRYFDGKPIQARRVGWVERGVKWAQGHRIAILIALGCLFLPSWIATALLVMTSPKPLTPGTYTEPNPPPSGTPQLDPADAARAAAEQFLKHAAVEPFGDDARKWASKDFSFSWTSGPVNGRDRPWYQVIDPKLDLPKVIEPGVIEFRGTATVLRRKLGDGFSFSSGGKATFTQLMRKGAEGWRVSQFEFEDRGSRAGPAELPDDVTRQEIADTLNYPAEAFAKDDLAGLEKKLGMKSWVFYHSGGPTSFRLVAERDGEKPDELMSADFTGQEGRVCVQIGRVMELTGRVSDTARVRMNSNNYANRGLPFLWYHWKGAAFTEKTDTADLSDGKEHEILTVTATEIEPAEGKEPGQVVLRLLAKKVEKK